jgi:spermidine/putrescine transport system permease protein
MPAATQIRFGERLTRRGEYLRSALTSGPAILWVGVFLLLPLLAVLGISFLTRGSHGEILWQFSSGNYERLAGFGVFGFDPLYPRIFLRSLAMGLVTTIVCLVASLPLAFFLTALPPRWKVIALVLLVIPFWTNLLIRTYAWQILLAPQSALAQLSAALGFTAPGEALYPGTLAVYVGMLCAYLPFMALPLYSAVEKLDWSIAEAARDLGADGARVFRHAILPQILPGIGAGVILVFVPAIGQFVVPDLLGGAKTAMLGNAIQQQFGASRDWPFGSAIATAAMSIVLLALWWHARASGARREDLI